MAPAQQRLGAAHAAARDVDFRLVVQFELAVADRVAQVGFEREALFFGLAHLLAIEAERAVRDAARGAHRSLGAAQEQVERCAVAREHADAGVHGNFDVVTFDRERLAQRCADRLDRHFRRNGRSADARQHHELVAGETSEHVAAREHAAQTLGQQAQHLIADLVAERVVDRLEAVDVEHRDRERRAGAVRGGDGLLGGRDDRDPRRQTRQGVTVIRGSGARQRMPLLQLPQAQGEPGRRGRSANGNEARSRQQ